jgi:hypothetical protein
MAMQTSENREKLLIDEYLNEIMSREKPDVKMYQGTIDFILLISVQKIIAELDELRKLVLGASEKHAHSVLKNHIGLLESIYGQSGSNRVTEAQEMRDLCIENDFKTASCLFIEKQLFRTYKVDMQRLERLPGISYDNFFYYNQMAPSDVDIAEDVYYLNQQVNRFFYMRFLFDLEILGLGGDHGKNDVGGKSKSKNDIIQYLANLIGTHTDWQHTFQIGGVAGDVMTVRNGILADEGFLFSKISSVALTKRSRIIPTTFLLATTEEAIRSAYKELIKSNKEFGLDNTEDAFLYLFQGKPITSNYKPIVWHHTLRSLTYFFSKMVKEGVLLKKTWQSYIIKHSLIIHYGKIPTKDLLKATKGQISDRLEISDREAYNSKEYNEYRFFLSIVDLLKPIKH